MPTASNALQKAIYQRLTAQIPAITVYDFVKQDAAPPFIRIGEDMELDWSTKSESGFEYTVTIHAWDYEKAGRKSVKTILGQIYDALHQQETSISVTGFKLVNCRFDGSDTFQETSIEGDSDRYWHGWIRFRATIDTLTS